MRNRFAPAPQAFWKPGRQMKSELVQLNGDFLLTYRINHGTALYVGYNQDAQNYDPSLTLVGGEV